MMRALRGTFVSPEALLVTLALALVLGLALALASRSARKRLEALVSRALAPRVGIRSARVGNAVTVVLSLLTLLGVGAALARPRWGAKQEKAERRGADVVLLVDTSTSMRAADVAPSRWVLARQAASSLLERLGGDRVALIACEGEAQTLVPLTLDTAATGLFLDALEPGIGAKPGTSIAAAVNAASELFPAGAVTGKNCVLISDGEDLEGGVDEAIDRAKREGIVIHTVFVGGKGAPVPEFDVAGRVSGYKMNETGSPILSKPDPDLMRKVAAATGGSFTTVSTGHTDLDGVAALIDKTARRPLSEMLVTNLEERFQIPLFVAAVSSGLLLLGAGSISFALKRKVASLLIVSLLAPAALAAQPQNPAPATPSGAAPAPAPTPVPDTLLKKIAARPPFTTARSEAIEGQKALEKKEVDSAIARFGRQVELDPKDLTGAYNLGTAYGHKGSKEEALTALNTVRQKAPADLAAEASYNAGATLFRAGSYEEAAKAFRESLRLKPGDADTSWNYELCQRRAEEKKKQDQKGGGKQDPKQGQATPTPTPQPKPGDKKNDQQQKQDQEKKDQDEKQAQQEKEEKDFEKKAKMSREKAEQLLAAINKSDLDEQKRKIAAQKSKRRVGKDW